MRYATLFLLLLVAPLALVGQQATPDISISANGTRNLSLFPGWPLIVHVTIMNSSRLDHTTATPLVIAPPGAVWTTAISFTALSSTGQSSHWPLTLVGAASSPTRTSQGAVTSMPHGRCPRARSPRHHRATISLRPPFR